MLATALQFRDSGTGTTRAVTALAVDHEVARIEVAGGYPGAIAVEWQDSLRMESQ